MTNPLTPTASPLPYTTLFRSPPAGDLRGGQRAHARGLPAARRDGAARSRRAGRHAAPRVPVPGRYRSGRGKSAVGAGDLRPAAGAGGFGRTADRLGAGTAGTHALGAGGSGLALRR